MLLVAGAKYMIDFTLVELSRLNLGTLILAHPSA
jgi:hypothetical protein